MDNAVGSAFIKANQFYAEGYWEVLISTRVS